MLDAAVAQTAFTVVTTSSRFNGLRCSCRRPPSMLATSSTSLTRWRSAVALTVTDCSNSRCCAGICSVSINWAQLITAFSGVRNSWLMVLMKRLCASREASACSATSCIASTIRATSNGSTMISATA